jgi:hypothetical protein
MARGPSGRYIPPEPTVAIDSQSLATALQQIGEVHGQMTIVRDDIKTVREEIKTIVERVEKVEAWQKRYGGMWWVFCLGAACGMITVGEAVLTVMRLWPEIAKFVK